MSDFPPLVISAITLRKVLQTGEWQLHQVKTNKGTFELGPIENKVNQQSVIQLTEVLSRTIKEQLDAFLETEKPPEKPSEK